MGFELFQLVLGLLLTKCIIAQNECHWLRIIYRKMGGGAVISWDCCRMNGVFCTEDGHVTGINWSRQGLTGSIPSEIEKLVNLEEL
jgi:hypothetical protein